MAPICPSLTAPQTLQQALAAYPTGGIALIAWEEERAISLYDALRASLAGRVPAASPEVRIFIGPEGGFSAEEIAVAGRYAATPVTLGRRILRAETAAIAAVALVMEVLRDCLAGKESRYPGKRQYEQRTPDEDRPPPQDAPPTAEPSPRCRAWLASPAPAKPAATQC